MTVSAEDRAGVRRVTVTGAVTEATDFSAALAGESTDFVVDLRGVERVNSYGVREWIRFVAALGERGGRITLEGVSVPMVRQMNMIPQVRGSAAVGTVFAPYYCPECDDERPIELPAGAREAPAQATCPVCGAGMEFDDVPESYFLFRSDEPREPGA